MIPGGAEPVIGRHRPVVIVFLVVINIIVFIYTTSSGIPLYASSQQAVNEFGFKPGYIFYNPQRAIVTMFTSMFVHADLLHIFFNMYFLWLFGSRIERTIGHLKTLLLYFLSGLAAILFHIGFIPIGGYESLLIPAVGASGAISGVLGAYLLLFPHTRLSLCFFYFFIPFCFNLPAYAFLLFWFAEQVLYGYLQLGGVAYFAHIGGFVMGLFLIPHLYKPRRRYPVYLDYVLKYLYEYLGIQVVRPRGLGRTAKTILVILLLLVATGFMYAAYSSTNAPFNTYIVNVKTTLVEGAVEDTILLYFMPGSPTPIDFTLSYIDSVRITLNRLQPLLYNSTYEGKGGEVEYQYYLYTVRIRGVDVEVVLRDFYAKYNEKGVMVYSRGVLDTYVVVDNKLGSKTTISFNYNAYDVNLDLMVPLCLLAASLSVFAISSILKSDETSVFSSLELPGAYPYI